MQTVEIPTMVLTSHTEPTNRLESDMTQESLLQQCTSDRERRFTRDENARERI